MLVSAPPPRWVQQYPNLVVLRTFSKCAALAGLRVGWGAFPLDLAQVRGRVVLCVGLCWVEGRGGLLCTCF